MENKVLVFHGFIVRNLTNERSDNIFHLKESEIK